MFGLAVLLQSGRLTFDELIYTDDHPVDALCEAGTDVAPAVVRLAARGDAAVARRAWSGGSGAAVRVALLEAAVGDRVWTAELHSQVLERTTDPDPRVRRTAYRVLTATDPRDWPAAVLACEATLDDDESVRAIAPR